MESIVSVKPTSIERDTMNKINQFVIIAVVSIFSAACYAGLENIDFTGGLGGPHANIIGGRGVNVPDCQLIKEPLRKCECECK